MPNTLRLACYIAFSVLILLAFGPQPSAHAQSAPVISNIQQSPATPTHQQVVTVSANVASADSITSVTIVDLNVGNDIPMQLTNNAYEAAISGQNAGTRVNFKIRAQDSSGDTTTSDEQSYDVGLTNFTLTAVLNETEELVTLSWNTVPGATSYDVYRSLEPGADIIIQAGLSDPGYIDTRIGSARELYYRVVANGGGISQSSNEQGIFQAFNSSPFSTVGGRLDTLLVAPSANNLSFPNLELNLNELFKDDDGDVLMFVLPDPGAAFDPQLVDDSLLVVSFPAVLGQLSFRIRADDGRFGSAFIDFFVTLDAPPRFAFDGDEPDVDQDPTRDQPVTITVNVDDNNLERVNINFRRGGDDSFFIDEMIEVAPGTYAYTIPAFAVDDRGLEYTLQAQDQNGLISTAPDLMSASRVTYSLEVLVPEEGIRNPAPQPAASTTPNAYRLFSIPILATDNSPVSILEDDLRSYKPARWRFFEPEPTTPSALFPEFPNTSPITPGKAFWLIVRDENQLIDTGTGRTLPTDAPFEIPLVPGWNFIGNPFNFDIPVSRLVTDDGAATDIRFFDGSGWFIVNDEAPIKPFAGYAVSNNSAEATTLRIFPSAELLALQQGTAANKKPSTKADWTVDIIASSGAMQDTSRIVQRSDSKPGWDLYDLPAPPAFGDHVAVAFVRDAWERPLTRYTVDARPQQEDGDVWTFEVSATQSQSITLTFAGLDALPENREVVLIDPQRQTSQDLRINPSYIVSSQRQQLQVAIGPTSFTDTQERALEQPTDTYQLAPAFPNPFTQTTTIPFHLPEAASVTLGIYNVLGENVTTLAQARALPAGPNALIWNGTNKEGSPVANGLYFVKLTAGTFVATDTIVLVR